MFGRLPRLVLALVAVSVVGGALFLWQVNRRYVAPGPAQTPIIAYVPKGSGLNEAASRLEQAGVIRSALVLRIGAKLAGARLRAGEYLFPAGISSEGAVAIMVEGHTVVHKLTVAEGLTVKRVLEMIRDADYLAGSITVAPAEGSLLPDTWHLSRDDNRDEVIQHMQRAMTQALDQAWAGRAGDLPVTTKAEALVMASIVERETAIPSERPHVAAVFENRLKLGMRLQSDPTTIYGLSDGAGVLPRPLVHDDLLVPHRWNTYVIPGLPPTPIANPSRGAIEAVLHPSDSEDLYFVADGGGGHVFAKTLAAHNQNVTHLRHAQAGESHDP